MKNRLINLLLAILLLTACSQDEYSPAPADSPTTGRTVRFELSLRASPMPGSADGVTRGEVPLSADEATIRSLCVLQFAGTADGSPLVKKGEVPASDIAGGQFAFDFEELTGGGAMTVYVLANLPATALDGVVVNTTTLGAFRASALGVTPLTEEAMKTSGLPMLASQSFVSDPEAFSMKALLAKVRFQYRTEGFTFANVSLRAHNLASGVPVTELPAGTSVQHPAGISYNGSLTLVGDDSYNGAPTVCYLPENLSGQVAAITTLAGRGGADVPRGAAYLSIRSVFTLSALTYNFYLGDGTASDFNMKRHCQYSFRVKIDGADPADKRVTLQTANCYMVDADNTAYSFLATVMGNGATTPADGDHTALITPTALSPASAVVLWEQSDPSGAANTAGDVVTNVRFSNGYIHFTTGAKPGNAVIAALDGGNTIIWSWHIWRPASNPGDVECYTPKNGGRTFTMMGLNLGAFNNEVNDVKAFGLQYQWGRKDPFPGSTGINTNDSYGNATFNGVVTENGYSFTAQDDQGTTQAAIGAPMSFYYTYKDWNSVRQDNLWGNPYTRNGPPNPDLGSKSIYDPCPVGYRVPPQDTWWQATTSNSNWDTNGMNLGVGVGGTTYFYPASGYRVGSSGSLCYVGSGGFYWSSSPDATSPTYGGNMTFYQGSVYPANDYGRAYGFGVRCAQEF